MPALAVTPAAWNVTTIHPVVEGRLASSKEDDVDAWQGVMLAVVALLIGALLPALVQLTPTLRAWRATAERTERAVVAITATAERLDRLTARLEEGGRIEHFLQAIDSLSRTVTRLQEATRVAAAVGAAVGPAVGAAVRSWRASQGDGASRPDDASEPSPEPERKEAKS